MSSLLSPPMSGSSAPSPFDAHLGYWLRFVSNQVSHSFALKLAAHDVTVAEWVVLRELFDAEPMAPSWCAGRLGMTRGAVSKLTDRLESKALIERAAGGEDRRFQSLALTAQGRALVPVLARLADENDAEFFGHFDKSTRAAIEAALREIARRHGMRAVPIT